MLARLTEDIRLDRDGGNSWWLQEIRLGGPIVIASDAGLVERGARNETLGFVEKQRRKGPLHIVYAGEQAEGIIVRGRKMATETAEGIEGRARLPVCAPG